MCSEQSAVSRFSHLSRWCTVGNNHFSTWTMWLWLILPASSRVMQAAISWYNSQVKALVSSRDPSHTTYRAHPRDMPHKQASLWLTGSHARRQTAWFWVEFLCLCIWACWGNKGDKMGGVDRSSEWQLFIPTAELLHLKEILLDNWPRRWIKTTSVLGALGGSSPTFYSWLSSPHLQ